MKTKIIQWNIFPFVYLFGLGERRLNSSKKLCGMVEHQEEYVEHQRITKNKILRMKKTC